MAFHLVRKNTHNHCIATVAAAYVTQVKKPLSHTMQTTAVKPTAVLDIVSLMPQNTWVFQVHASSQAASGIPE